jgi:hypothetical protein
VVATAAQLQKWTKNLENALLNTPVIAKKLIITMHGCTLPLPLLAIFNVTIVTASMTVLTKVVRG